LILEKRADARETVAAGQPVVIFGRLDKGWVVRAGLPATDAVRINVGDAVQVQLDTATADAAALPGKVRRIAAASDPRTGSVELEVALPATKSRLVSGMVARLEFSIGSAKQDGKAGKNASDKNPTVSLPLAAVLEGNAGRAVVFILAADKKKVQRIEVKTGRLIDGGIEILDGLPSGAQVVSEGAAWLSDGDSVRVLP
jgi:RND family efflux transporter MFP subunit